MAEQASRQLLVREETQEIGRSILESTSADDALIRIRHLREATTRFSRNSIAFQAATERREVSLTVYFGRRKGTATSESTCPEDLKALVRSAEEIARGAPPDPEVLPTLGPQEYLAVDAHREATEALPADAMTDLAGRVCAPAAKSGLIASGTIETASEATGLMTAHGLSAYHRSTAAEIGCTIATPTSSGWTRAYDADVTRLEPERLATRAIEQAERSANPKAIEPGKYTVLLMPAAVGSLAQLLVYFANARLTEEGLTYLSGRVGEKLAGDEITIYSDPQDPDLPCRPFDDEGLPLRKTVWIDRGRFREQWWDRWTAHKASREPVPLPGNILMSGSTQTVDELISTIERGVLINHIWYIRVVKGDQTLVTAMTRDGTFWIEDGRVRHGLKNLRFNESCLGMVRRTVALGRPEICVDREMRASRFPPLVVRDWNFVGVTGE